VGRLDGKIAVITGACSGIGRATLELFVAEGAAVVAADIQDDLGKEIESRRKGAVRYAHCDVSDEKQIEAAMKAAADAFGGIDILFNNAGAGSSPNTIADMTGEAWDRAQNLLLRSAVLGMRYALPYMQKRGGGAIVSTASIAGAQAGAGPVAYSVAKAGVIHLTTVAAAQLAQYNVRVNAICPGLIVTNIFAPGMSREMGEQVKTMMRETAPSAQPVKKAGLPEDIAQACLFLASDAAAFITGESLFVDGGMHVGPRNAWDPQAQAERAQAREARAARAAAMATAQKD
jgi:NAD(P)-dependent dehydrogenase (short-subunit alcohol dehydrogenase family)